MHYVDPLGYLEFNYLVKHAKGVITDSGGITEETTVLGVPCLTLRDNTERPETVTIGTNELIGTDPSKLPPALEAIDGRAVEEGRDPADMGRQSGGTDCGTVRRGCSYREVVLIVQTREALQQK